jgi:DNA-binding beta-propeller fold protein YncE
VNEFDALIEWFSQVPAPDDAAVARARHVFVARIAHRQRVPRWVSVVVLAVLVLAAVAGVLAFLPSRASGLNVKRIIRASYAITLPPAHGIRYLRTVTGGGVVQDVWLSAAQPFALHERSPAGSELEWTACGSIGYDAGTRMLGVNMWRVPATVQRTLRLGADPLFTVREALRAHEVEHVRAMTFRSIPAYEIVAARRGVTLTLIVRRGTYVPLFLRTDNGAQVFSERIVQFETLPRTPRTEPLLHVSHHNAILVTRTGPSSPPHGCASFGRDALRSGPVVRPRPLPTLWLAKAKLRAPEALAISPDGNQLYVSEYGGRRVDAIGDRTLSILPGYFVAPTGLTVAADGTLDVVDHRADRVVEITPDNKAHTVLGSVAARLHDPIGIALDPSGGIDVADEQNHRIVHIATDGRTTVLLHAPQISNPSYLVRDRAGDLYFTDFIDNRIRKLDRHGVLSVVAPKVRLNFPTGLTIASNGDLYVSDADNNRVLRITPAGTATTVAGNGTPGFAGDGGPATKAELNAPAGLALDRFGDLYIADQGNNRIRRVDAKTRRIKTIAGHG